MGFTIVVDRLKEMYQVRNGPDYTEPVFMESPAIMEVMEEGQVRRYFVTASPELLDKLETGNWDDPVSESAFHIYPLATDYVLPEAVEDGDLSNEDEDEDEYEDEDEDEDEDDEDDEDLSNEQPDVLPNRD